MKRVTGVLISLLIAGLGPSSALAVDSGSTGSNGAFPPAAGSCAAGTLPVGTTTLDLQSGALTLPGGEVRQVQTNCQTASPVPSSGFADGILHFTTVNVPTGVTLKFVRNDLNTPGQILAQSSVSVGGTIDVSGTAGGPAQQGNGKGGLSGPGGFKGGNGQTFNNTPKAGDGLGPGGGAGGFPAGNSGGAGAGFGTVGGTSSSNGGAGGIYGTAALLPLVGGSGGGGGPSVTSGGTGNGGGGGGGGGGAILIASSTTINVTGSILANGGGGGSQGGAGGSGGAIRLLANTLSGNGTLSAAGGSGAACCTGGINTAGSGGLGRIRLEANFFTFSGPSTGNRSDGGPGFVFLANTPTVRITSVTGGTPPTVSATPIGAFGGADVSVPGPGTYTVGLQASNVPLGTTIVVTAKPETDLANPASATSIPLAGTAASSTASATLTFTLGGLYFLEARATFQFP